MIVFSGLRIAIAHIIYIRVEGAACILEMTSGTLLREWKDSQEEAESRANEIADIVSGYGKHS